MVNAPNGYFGKDLAQFDDCLFGGLGLEAPCEIIWKNSDISKQRLNSEIFKKYYEEKRDFYEEELKKEMKELYDGGRRNIKEDECFSYDMVNYSKRLIEKSKNSEFNMFNKIVEIIQSVTDRAKFNKNWILDLVLE